MTLRAAGSPAEQLSREYSEKAIAYERCWAPAIGPMALPLLEQLPLADARLVVDIGAGTGRHLGPLTQAAPRACVVGVDRADGMLRVARRGRARRVAAMDAQQLAIRPGIADVTTLIFMLFHLPDPAAGLAEVRRVLRPGGAVGVVTWGADPGTPGLSFWKEELDVHGADPDPRDPSVMQQAIMDTPDKLDAVLSAAGFARTRVSRRTFDYQWTVAELVELQATCGMPARRLQSLTPAVASACRAKVVERLVSLREAELVYQPEVLYAVATAPG